VGSGDPTSCSVHFALISITLSFNKQAYVSTFEPLMLEEGAAQLVRGGDEDGGSGEATSHGAAVGGGAPGAPGGGALRDAGGGFGAVTLVLDGGAPAAASFADNDAVLVTVGDSKVR